MSKPQNKFRAIAIILLLLDANLVAQEGPDPIDHLPPNVELLVAFGERPDISPDNREVAFMEKSFGDAYVYNLETKRLRCLTGADPYASYLRVMHLSNGDYILIGSGKISMTKLSEGRGIHNKLWYLSRQPHSKPVDLDQLVFEGIAISKESLKIAYSVSHYQIPEMGEGNFKLYAAEISLTNGTPKIINRTLLKESHYPPAMMEAQDFYDHDHKLTYNIYRRTNDVEIADVMSYDFATKESTDMSRSNCHMEAEGVFPDGKYTLVESDLPSKLRGFPAGKTNGWPIDLFKLKLDGTGKDFTRLTWISDTPGYHASNPVVSTDGRFMVFSIGYSRAYGLLNGAGHGILLQRFDRAQ